MPGVSKRSMSRMKAVSTAAVTAPMPGMVSRWLGFGQGAIGRNQQVFQAFLPAPARRGAAAPGRGPVPRMVGPCSEAIEERACSSSGSICACGQVGDGVQVLLAWRLPGTRRWGSGGQFEDPAGGRCP